VGGFQSNIEWRKGKPELARQLLSFQQNRPAGKRRRSKRRNKTMVAKKTGKVIQTGKKLKGAPLTRRHIPLARSAMTRPHIPMARSAMTRSALTRSALTRSALTRSALTRSALTRSALTRSALTRPGPVA
jgi:Tfp pilus assembly protein PilF